MAFLRPHQFQCLVLLGQIEYNTLCARTDRLRQRDEDVRIPGGAKEN